MKKTVYIDIDDTIVNFSKQAVQKLNKICQTNKNYMESIKFDFVDLFPDLSREEKEKIYFDNFYEGIEKFENMEEVLLEINKNFNIVFVTKGRKNSLKEKEEWLKNNLNKKIKYKFIGLPMTSDKTEVDMSNGIIIDDQYKYVEKSKANIKILYSYNRKETEWNNYLTNIDAYIVENWQQILEILNFIAKKGIYTND